MVEESIIVKKEPYKKEPKEKKGRRRQERAEKKDKERWRSVTFKYNKDKAPIIAFGNGMKGKDSSKINGHQVGLTGSLYRLLKCQEKERRLLVVYVDEFRTSK
ncbi:hypothetical protein K7432_014732, partial [Basidiobolus ranarum]